MKQYQLKTVLTVAGRMGRHILAIVGLGCIGAIGAKANDKVPPEAFEQQVAEIARLTATFPAPAYAATPDKDSWMGSDAGQSDAVLPPWHPVRRSGMKLDVWNRSYEIGESALPKTVLSGGNRILAKPARYSFVAGGQELPLASKSTIVAEKDTRVVLRSEGTAGGFQIRSTTTVEYDGFGYVETEIVPPAGGTALDSLTLEFDLPADAAQFYHHGNLGTQTPLKANPDLFILNMHGAGRISAAPVALPWTTQLTFSGRELGWSVGFIDNRDWRSANPEKAVEILPRGETVTMRFNLMGPGIVRERSVFRWYFQALPVRPATAWRDYEKFFSHQEANAARFLPLLREDRNGVAPIDAAIAKGLKVIIVHQDWTELQGYPGTFEPKRAEILRQVVKGAHRRGLKVVIYLARELSSASPEWREHAVNMLQFPLQAGRGREAPKAVSMRPRASAGFNDLLVHGLRNLIREFDIDGVFLDGNPSVGLSYNLNTGHGYQGPDGSWHGTSDVLHVREQMRRIYTLFKHEAKKDGIVIGHSGLWNPSFAYLDLNLAGEMETYNRKINPHFRLKDVLSFDYYAALFNPAATGAPVLWMSKPTRGGLNYDANNTVTLQFGVMPRVTYSRLLYRKSDANPTEVDRDERAAARSFQLWERLKAFGMGNAASVPFWKIADFCDVSMEPSPNRAVGMHFISGQRALVLVSNGETQQTKFKVAPLAEKIGFTPMVARDLESGETLVIQNGAVTVEVPEENFRLIEFTPQTPARAR